jgi:hypothetical protein
MCLNNQEDFLRKSYHRFNIGLKNKIILMIDKINKYHGFYPLGRFDIAIIQCIYTIIVLLNMYNIDTFFKVISIIVSF